MPERPPRDDAHRRQEIAANIHQSQGGNKVLVVSADDELYNIFRNVMNPQSARFIFRCDNAQDILKNPRAELICIGPFWAHPHWDSMYEMIQREKSRMHKAVRVSWFPMFTSGSSLGKPQELDLSGN